jgi:hypothetical protein
MKKQYKISTNWLPWLGFGFLLSTVFLGFVSNSWLLFLLIILSFMPAIVVALALKGYVLLENNQIKTCYDRKIGREVTSSLNVVDITSIERVGKSLVFHLDNDEDVTMRVSWANILAQEIVEQNPRIEYDKK